MTLEPEFLELEDVLDKAGSALLLRELATRPRS
jgi:hypothetical protein